VDEIEAVTKTVVSCKLNGEEIDKIFYKVVKRRKLDVLKPGRLELSASEQLSVWDY